MSSLAVSGSLISSPWSLMTLASLVVFFISFFLIFQKFFELVPPSFIRRLILVLVMITSSAWIACLSSVLFLMYSFVRACIVLGGWFWLIALSCSFLAIDFSFLRCFILLTGGRRHLLP